MIHVAVKTMERSMPISTNAFERRTYNTNYKHDNTTLLLAYDANLNILSNYTK